MICQYKREKNNLVVTSEFLLRETAAHAAGAFACELSIIDDSIREHEWQIG